jgi:hypothetical protein
VLVVLPPLGALAVEVVGHRPGDHSTPETSVVLQVVAPPGSARPPAHQLSLDAAGRVRWPQVALDRRWRVSLRPLPRQQELAGPTRAGETATARFVLPVPLEVTGRLWHASQPLADHQFSYSLTTARGPEGSLASTDVEGRFRLTARAAAPGQSLLLRVGCTVGGAAQSPSRETVTCSAASAMPLTYAIPSTDVGDLHLTPVPLLVAAGWSAPWIASRRRCGSAPPPAPTSRGRAWQLDASGAFACYGPPPPGRARAAGAFAGARADRGGAVRARCARPGDHAARRRDAARRLRGRRRHRVHHTRAAADPERRPRARRPARGRGRRAHRPSRRHRPRPPASSRPPDPQPRAGDIPLPLAGAAAGRYRVAMLGYGQDTELHGAEVELAAGAHRALPAVDLRGARAARARAPAPRRASTRRASSVRTAICSRCAATRRRRPAPRSTTGLVFLAVRDPLDMQLDVKGYRRQVLRGDRRPRRRHPAARHPRCALLAQSSAGARRAAALRRADDSADYRGVLARGGRRRCRPT